MSEFNLIETYFTWDDSPNHSKNIIKSVGDDAAVLSLGPNQQLVTSIDTLVSGVHFPENTSAFDIGHKALAVNLSDLAAMGSKPEWFTLALTLPEIDHDWLSEFSRGLKALAQKFGIALVGGDTTSGPLAISIQVMGSVNSGKALYRSGAKQGDKIYVTGTIGDGAVGLASILHKLDLSTEHAEYCQQRLNRPTPRNHESEIIQPFASACIDLSDGLLQDLSHIIEQSTNELSKAADSMEGLGAKIDLSQIPLSNALQNIDSRQAIHFALNGGDDYELLFTIPEALEAQFLASTKKTDFQFTCIGHITNDNRNLDKSIVDKNNNPLIATGYNHFT